VVSFKTINELRAHPGRRSEVISIVDQILSTMDEVPGVIRLTRYEVIDDEDTIIEIVDWESSEARTSWILKAEESGSFEPLVAALASPLAARSIRLLM
jgi:heme-degrading monooxygenase HmoA